MARGLRRVGGRLCLASGCSGARLGGKEFEMRILRILIAPLLGVVGLLPLMSGCEYDEHRDHDRQAYPAGYRYEHDRDRDWDHDRDRDRDDWHDHY